MYKKYQIQFTYDGELRSYTISSTNDYSKATHADETLLKATIEDLIKLYGLYKKGKTVSNASLLSEKGEPLVCIDGYVMTV